jgi:hypothetical protein
MDVLAQRRGLFLMPVLSSPLVELINGSTAPFLNFLLGTAPTSSPVTLATLTCAQAKFILKTFIDPFATVQPYVFPGP